MTLDSDNSNPKQLHPDLAAVLEQAIMGDDGWQRGAGATQLLEFEEGWVAAWGDPANGGLLHREDGPASIEFFPGHFIRLAWRQHGFAHREDGPALIQFDANYELELEQWCLNGLDLGRLDDAA